MRRRVKKEAIHTNLISDVNELESSMHFYSCSISFTVSSPAVPRTCVFVCAYIGVEDPVDNRHTTVTTL